MAIGFLSFQKDLVTFGYGEGGMSLAYLNYCVLCESYATRLNIGQQEFNRGAFQIQTDCFDDLWFKLIDPFAVGWVISKN